MNRPRKHHSNKQSAEVSRRGRILCVTSNFPRWEGDSVTPFVLRLAQDLISEGWEIDVLAPHDQDASFKETLESVPTERFRYFWPTSAQTVCYRGGALVNLRKHRTNYIKVPSLVGCELMAVTKRLLTRRYDLVHAHWILPQGFTCALAAKLSRTPLVVTAHGGDVFALRGRVLRPFKSATLRMADAVTTNSQLTRRAVLNIEPNIKHLEQIPESPADGHIDQALKNELRSKHKVGDGPLLIFLARLVEEKGLGDLLHAVATLREKIPTLRLLVVGDGQDRELFERQAADLGIDGCVAFMGWIDQSFIPTYLAAADIFVGPSRQAVDGWIEAQGLTFVESMLAGTPIIASRVGGIVESIRDGETGLLVDEKSPKQIADAICTLLDSPALAESLVNRARHYALNNLSRKYAVSKYTHLFERLIHGAPNSVAHHTRFTGADESQLACGELVHDQQRT